MKEKKWSLIKSMSNTMRHSTPPTRIQALFLVFAALMLHQDNFNHSFKANNKKLDEIIKFLHRPSESRFVENKTK